MKFKYCGFLIGTFCLQFSVSLCGFKGCSDFTPTFVGLLDQILDDPNALISDPEMTFNNWIQTENTIKTCCDIQIGGYKVTFTGDQLLHGSFGGVEGTPAGVEDSVDYGYRIAGIFRG